MNVRDVIKSVRDDYVEQFDTMVQLQRAKRSDGYCQNKMRVRRKYLEDAGPIMVESTDSRDS